MSPDDYDAFADLRIIESEAVPPGEVLLFAPPVVVADEDDPQRSRIVYERIGKITGTW